MVGGDASHRTLVVIIGEKTKVPKYYARLKRPARLFGILRQTVAIVKIILEQFNRRPVNEK